MSGQAASYYDPNQGFAQGPPQQQQQQQQQPYYNYNYNNGYDPRNNGNYPVEPKPQYPPQAAPPPPPPQSGYNFDDAFKIEKPKFNDLWAGLLVSRTSTHKSQRQASQTDILAS